MILDNKPDNFYDQVGKLNIGSLKVRILPAMSICFPGYRISEQIYNGSRTLVDRVWRESDQQPATIKILNNPALSFALFSSQIVRNSLGKFDLKVSFGRWERFGDRLPNSLAK